MNFWLFFIALFLIMVVTKAYTKSFSTTLVIIVSPLLSLHTDIEGNTILLAIDSILLLRAIINNMEDKFIKRINDV